MAAPAAPAGGMRRPAVVSLGSGVLNQVALLVTGVLAARSLGPDGRGTQALLTLLPFVLSQLGTLGMPSAVVYLAGAAGVSSRGLVRLLRRPAAVQAGAAAVVQLAVLVGVAQLFDVGSWAVALLTVPVLVVMIAVEYAIAVLQSQHRLGAVQVLRVGPNVLYAVVLAVVVAVSDGIGLAGVMVCWFGALVAGGLLCCALAARGLTDAGREGDSDSDGELVARMRAYGRRSFLGAVSPLEYLRADQLLAGFVLGPVALGLYVSASAFTGLTRTLSQSLGVIAYPDVARRHRAGGGGLQRGLRYVALVAAATAVIAAVVIAIAPWLVTVTFGAEFADAAGATRILIVAGALLAVRRVAGDVARGLGRGSVNSWAEGVTLAALLVAFLVVGTAGSATDAAWAVLVAAGCGLVVLVLQVVRPRPAG